MPHLVYAVAITISDITDMLSFKVIFFSYVVKICFTERLIFCVLSKIDFKNNKKYYEEELLKLNNNE